jgi:hypothetical protein
MESNTMRMLSCLLLSALSLGAAAQSCQGINFSGQGIADKIEDDSRWDFVRFNYRQTLGVDCEMEVTLTPPRADDAPAGFFEGVSEQPVDGSSHTSIIRELAIYPALGAGDEISVYEQSIDTGRGTRRDLVVRLVDDGDGRGTIYVLELQFASPTAVPVSQVLLEQRYDLQERGAQCLSGWAPACLSVQWLGGFANSRIDVRLAVAGGAVQDKSIPLASRLLPAMRMGYLGGMQRSSADAKVGLKHKVCRINGNNFYAGCSQRY